MRTLVTGGAGYIGSVLIRQLQQNGHNVRVLDDFSGSSPRNLKGNMDTDVIIGDVRDQKDVRRALENVDNVIHLAAITGAGSTHEIRDKTFDINYKGTVNLVNEAVNAGIDKFVFASSCNNYGRIERKDLAEEAEMNPINPYAESKVKAEKYVQNSDLDSVSLRMSTNYGYSPGIRFNLVINKFIFRALIGEPLTIYGDGSNWRPYINVKDASRAYIEALNWDEGIYNVGEGNYTIEQVAEKVKEVTGTENEITYLRDKDPGPSYNVNFDRMRSQGFTPEYGIEEGMKDLIKNLKQRS